MINYKIKPIHPFPARMAPPILWDSLSDTDTPLKILDPMSGSGTTLVCARAKGHYAMGCDSDPLALLIARAWCLDVDPQKVSKLASTVLMRAQVLANKLKYDNAYPNGVDEETREFINFWFDDENRLQLSALSRCISRVRSGKERILLWCAFSRLIITKSFGVSLAMDVSHSRPHKVYQVAPICPFDKYLSSVSKIIRNSPFQISDKHKQNKPAVQFRMGDARKLPVKSNSIDMIITSPPYLNAIDYLRGHKLSLVWMGYKIGDVRRLRSENIGSELSMHSQLEEPILNVIKAMGSCNELTNRQIGMLKRYALDMNKVLKECARVLKKKGRAVFVVGDSSLNGVFIRNSELLTKLAFNHGFSLVSRAVRPIEENRRYLPPPNSGQSGKQLQRRMREEVILKFML